MKYLFRKATQFLASNDLTFSFLKNTLFRFVDALNGQRWRSENEEIERWRTQHLKAPIVLHGPFAGLRYPGFTSYGSALYPKLLGSYEREIRPAIDSLLLTRFNLVVDVGCAEGYYAIGFARNMPDARIIAFDLDRSSRAGCGAMALCNDVADRVAVETFCDANRLTAIAVSEPRGLLICDCEGFELDLFTRESVAALATWHVLIEVHEFLALGVTKHLEDLFNATHSLERFDAIPDSEKLKSYDYSELENLSDRTKLALVSEHRPHGMQWFNLRPRAHSES